MAADHRPIVWSPRAKEDLRDVWRYYAHIASPETADKLLHEIFQSANRLSKDATMWRTRDEIAPGIRSVLVRPFTIFYRLRDDRVVEVARIVHERRNLDAIFIGNQ
jgi:toxin ParE1/3/4